MNGLGNRSGSVSGAREFARNELDEPDPRRCVRSAVGVVDMRLAGIMA
jgi:hypothetical protein